MPTPREMMEAARRTVGLSGNDETAGAQPREPREDQRTSPDGRTARTRTSSDAAGRSRGASSREAQRGSQRSRQRAGQEARSQQPLEGQDASYAADSSQTRTSRTSRSTDTQQSARERRAPEGQRTARGSRSQESARTRASSRTGQATHASEPSRTGEPSRAPEVDHRPQSRHMREVVTRWRMYGVAAFAVIMAIGGLVGLLFFARPTSSAVEMRNLTPFPEFTGERFLNGSFFTDLSLWYADTYPLREPMVAADHAVDSLFGINTGTGMVGGNVQTDEIPVEETEPDFSPVVPPAAAPDEKAVAADIQENIMSGVYIKDGAGYSIYYFSQYAADTYITAMNTTAEKLYGTSTVYSIMAPANSITLPDDEASAVGGSDQQQALNYLSSRFDQRVKAVDLVSTIKEHGDEYLYFHTDHHWTQLGAYYAYVELCKQKGVEPKELSSWRKVNLGELRGTYSDTIESMGFSAGDEVEGYIPASTNEMTYWTAYGEEVQGSVVDEGAVDWDPSFKYSAFIMGDQPLEIIHNPDLSDGSSCLVVKDSYGCAFVPCLVDQYETVHVIDFRETDQNICDYALENNIQDVIFMTGIKIGLTDSVAETLLAEVL